MNAQSTPASPTPGALPTALRLGWGVGGLGSYTVLSTYSLLLLFFMTTVLGIEPALAGTVVFASKLVDLVLAPVVGTMSDRTQSRWGRRRPYLLFGGVLCAVGLVLMFNLPAGVTQNAAVPYVAAALLAVSVGYTLFNVPYLAMPAEMTGDFHERTVLMSYRVFFVSIATVIGTSLAPMLVQWGGGGRDGYAAMSWLIAGVCFLAMYACFAGTRKARYTERSAAQPAWREQMRTALANAPFLWFMGAKFLQLIGLSASTVSLAFLVNIVLQRPPSSLALFGLAATVGSIVSQPVWVAAAKRLGKRNAYAVSLVGYAAVMASWWLATPAESTAIFGLRSLLAGLTAGGIMLIGTSLLPDCAEYDFRRTGLRREGMYAAFYSVVEKAAFAIGPLLSGALLSASGFVRSTGGAVAAQPPAALTAIVATAAVVPASMALLSLLFLARYRLSPEGLAATVPVPAAPDAAPAVRRASA
jgi:GPH family glycoside/pentoside/hexuronide:cation symporter